MDCVSWPFIFAELFVCLFTHSLVVFSHFDFFLNLQEVSEVLAGKLSSEDDAAVEKELQDIEEAVRCNFISEAISKQHFQCPV